MKKKALLLAIVTIATASSAFALEVKPYVSEKASFGNTQIVNGVMTGPLAGLTQIAYSEDTSGNFWGSKTAIGLITPIEEIKGAVRAEFEFGFNGKVDSTIKNANLNREFDGKIQFQTYGLNIYYDLNTESKYTPSSGTGSGLAHISQSDKFNNASTYGQDVFADISDNNLVWNISAGVSYALYKNWSLDLSYRYSDFGTAKGKVKGSGSLAGQSANLEADLRTHEALLGVRYTF